MKFVADESIDRLIIDAVRRNGHEVYAIRETDSGCSDEDVLTFATEQQGVVITFDKDFGDLVYRLNKSNHGIILLRLEGVAVTKKIDLINAVIKRIGDELYKSFVVITEDSVRVRKL